MRAPVTRWLMLTATVLLLSGCAKTGQSDEVTFGHSRVTSVLPYGIAHAARLSDYRDASRALLYISDNVAARVYVLSYPKGTLVDTLTGFTAPAGECTDARGDVWITDAAQGTVSEYAHGGSLPIATLTWTGANPLSCSVDPRTGNVAVANNYPPEVAVYTQTEGSPTIYEVQGFNGLEYCTYDQNGNLFVDGEGEPNLSIAELPYQADAFEALKTNESIVAGSLQWDGSYLAVVNIRSKQRVGPTVVYRIAISGSTGTIVSKVNLTGRGHRNSELAVQYWIQNSRIVGPYPHPQSAKGIVDLWAYPEGGHARRSYQLQGAKQLWGAAVSIAP